MAPCTPRLIVLCSPCKMGPLWARGLWLARRADMLADPGIGSVGIAGRRWG